MDEAKLKAEWLDKLKGASQRDMAMIRLTAVFRMVCDSKLDQAIKSDAIRNVIQWFTSEIEGNCIVTVMKIADKTTSPLDLVAAMAGLQFCEEAQKQATTLENILQTLFLPELEARINARKAANG